MLEAQQMVENKQVADIILKARADAQLRQALETDPQLVLKDYPTDVANAVLSVVPYLDKPQELLPSMNWWR